MKTKSAPKKHSAAPRKSPLLDSLIVAVLAALVFARPMIGVSFIPWVRVASGVALAVLFYFLSRGILHKSSRGLTASLILLTCGGVTLLLPVPLSLGRWGAFSLHQGMADAGLWAGMSLTLFLAPLLLSFARKSRVFMRIWICMVALLAVALLLPRGGAYAGTLLLLPTAMGAAHLLGLWEDALKRARRDGVPFYLFCFNAITQAVLVIIYAAVLYVRYVRIGTVPMMTGLLLAAVAVGVVLLCISAISRRIPWDLVIGAVLFVAIWRLLGAPVFDIF